MPSSLIQDPERFEAVFAPLEEQLDYSYGEDGPKKLPWYSINVGWLVRWAYNFLWDHTYKAIKVRFCQHEFSPYLITDQRSFLDHPIFLYRWGDRACIKCREVWANIRERGISSSRRDYYIAIFNRQDRARGLGVEAERRLRDEARRRELSNFNEDNFMKPRVQPRPQPPEEMSVRTGYINIPQPNNPF